MSRVAGGCTPRGMMALVILGALSGGQAYSQTPRTSLEPLLTVADLAAVGLTGVVLASLDAYDRTEELGFVRASDEWVVLNLARVDVNSAGVGSLEATVNIIATDVVVVDGVGDEAYSLLGGMFLYFRKGTTTFQLSTGIDVMGGGKLFLTTEQLAQLAKVVCGRL